MKRTKEKRGITLIALIITIIVLLILAGVTISMVVGDNGVLKQAQNAKIKTEKAKDEELRGLTAAEAGANLELTWYQDGENKVPIPAGFAVSQVEGENTVEDGLVIIDSNGNEFVWIPVTNMDNFKRTKGYGNDGNIQSSNEQVKIENCDEANENGKNSKLEESKTTQEEAKEMYASVKKYGGFYIGRYEAGYEDGNYDEENNKWSENTKLVVKKDATVYNNIEWGNSMTDETGGAVEIARKFKEGKSWESSAVSTLVYGVQWDATMQFFDSNYINENCSTGSYARNSTGRGNYNEEQNTNAWKEKIAKTGALPIYAEKNIYDMAGNVWEWTMESFYTDYRIGRGGSCGWSGFDNPVSRRNGYKVETVSERLGFRVSLYLK